MKFLEYTFVRTIDHPEQKRGKIPPDRRAFKFDFGEHEGKQDRSAIFSCLESLKNGLKKTLEGYDSCMKMVQVDPTASLKPRVSSIVNLESLPKGKKTQTTV
jgi:hypothetical protein